MKRQSEQKKSEKKLPKLGLQAGFKEKPGRYFVRLNGRRTYLGYEDGTSETPSEVTQSYLETILQWQKNGCKPLPTQVKSNVSVESIAIKYLGVVESRCCKSHTDHCRAAMQFLIDHCGGLSVDDFTRHTLKHLQEKLEREGTTGRPFARPLINRYIGFIKTAFLEAEESGLCSESIVDSLARFRPLKRGKTTAREYESVDHVETEVVKATLPFMSETIRAMVQVHLLCTMRSQDVINLRTCDIEMNDPKYPDVWWYAPHDHKTKGRGKKLVKVIPPEAQEILRPFLDAKKGNPTAFIFSPHDVMKKYRENLRENRKSKPTPSQIERGKSAKKRKPKHPLGEQYTTGSYRTAVQRAQDRARKAGIDIPHWFPHQIRHESVSEINAQFGLEVARDAAGHAHSKVTKGYAHKKLDNMAKVALERKRIFS